MIERQINDPEAEFHNVVSAANRAVIGLSLMRDGVFNDLSREFVGGGIGFLEFMKSDLSRSRRLRPDLAALDPQPNFYDRSLVLANAGIEKLQSPKAKALTEDIKHVLSQTRNLAEGACDPDTAKQAWLQVRKWADWYFQARL